MNLKILAAISAAALSLASIVAHAEESSDLKPVPQAYPGSYVRVSDLSSPSCTFSVTVTKLACPDGSLGIQLPTPSGKIARYCGADKIGGYELTEKPRWFLGTKKKKQVLLALGFLVTDEEKRSLGGLRKKKSHCVYERVEEAMADTHRDGMRMTEAESDPLVLTTSTNNIWVHLLKEPVQPLQSRMYEDGNLQTFLLPITGNLEAVPLHFCSADIYVTDWPKPEISTSVIRHLPITRVDVGGSDFGEKSGASRYHSYVMLFFSYSSLNGIQHTGQITCQHYDAKPYVWTMGAVRDGVGREFLGLNMTTGRPPFGW